MQSIINNFTISIFESINLFRIKHNKDLTTANQWSNQNKDFSFFKKSIEKKTKVRKKSVK